MKLTVDAWYASLKDYDKEFITFNLVSYYNSGRAFPPTGGQLIHFGTEKKEIVSNNVPGLEETRKYLIGLDQQQALALNDPDLEKAKAEAQAAIRKTLGMRD